jgi:hypothetical protein
VHHEWVSRTDQFVALIAGIVAIIGGIAAMLRVLIKISYAMGSLTQQFSQHMDDAKEIGDDHETRLRKLEQGPQQQPPRRRY